MRIYTDGSGDGRFCYLREDGVSRVMRLPNLTSNEAEYWAVLRALQDAKRVGVVRVTIRSDSQLVVNQLNHKYRIREERLRKLAQRVWAMIGTMIVEFEWIHGKENPAGKLLG